MCEGKSQGLSVREALCLFPTLPRPQAKLDRGLESKLEVYLHAGAAGCGVGVGTLSLRWGGRGVGGPSPDAHVVDSVVVVALGGTGVIGCRRREHHVVHVVGRRATVVRPLELDAGRGGAAVREDRDAHGGSVGGTAVTAAAETVRRRRCGVVVVVVVVDVGVPAGGALLLVRVLVAAEHLRLEELLVAEEAWEQPHLLPTDAPRRRRHFFHLLTACGRRQGKREVHGCCLRWRGR